MGSLEIDELDNRDACVNRTERRRSFQGDRIEFFLRRHVPGSKQKQYDEQESLHGKPSVAVYPGSAKALPAGERGTVDII
jgi:hypothetical protein